jgi:hypothetical protein
LPQESAPQGDLNPLNAFKGLLTHGLKVVVFFDFNEIADFGMGTGMLGGEYRAAVLVG